LKTPGNGADFLIITDEAFIPAVQPMVQHYRQQRVRAMAVSSREIYDEFNCGEMDPMALKEFLRYAYSNWLPPAPTYVLLVGDANLDYLDNFNTGKKNMVPAFLTYTRDIGLVPDDNWLVSIDGDDLLPEMFIARLPGADVTSVADMMDKLLEHQQTIWNEPQKALFAADNNSPEFETLSDTLIAKMPESYDFSTVYLADYSGSISQATDDIVHEINDGLIFTNYIGHGAVTNWAGEFMFESADIPRLENRDRLTFVNAMNCINGFFSQPFYYCLAEEFLIASNGGAYGCLAPTGSMYFWEIELFSAALFDGLFSGHNTIMGSLATEAKLTAYARGATKDLLITSVLFGDPAGRLLTMLPGDLNADGATDALDLLIGKQVLSGNLEEYRDPCRQPAAGDFNQNGRLDSPDLTYLATLLVQAAR
jgi:hypothetical protein